MYTEEDLECQEYKMSMQTFFNDMGLLLGSISAGCTVMETGLVADPANSEGSIHNFSCPPNSLGAFWSPTMGLEDRRLCPFQWNKFTDIHRI